MFGSFNIGTDYTFTQSESQNDAVNKIKAISSYSGDSVVSKKSKTENEAQKVAPTFADANNQVQDNNNNQVQGDDDISDYQPTSDKKAASITNSFDALAAAVGGVGGKVTKDQLVNYLHSITSNPSVSAENVQEVTFIKGLIAQFDTLSGHTNYITSFVDVKEPQDYKTVTKEQVTPPVDIRV